MFLLFKKIFSRIKYSIIPQKEIYLLEMVNVLGNKPIETNLNQEYKLRNFVVENDLISYQQLLKVTEMGECPLDYWFKHILPNGFFVVEHITTKTIVGACFASHHPSERHPFAGNLGWLAVRPDHRGHKIAQVLVEQVVIRLLNAGYNRIYLETHDHRVPAILLYFKTGWVPFLYNDEVTQRWEDICKKINFQYEPNEWDLKIKNLN